jgi:uncharacterized membrane-anchored protein
MRTTLYWLALAGVLGSFGLMIHQQEALRQGGQTVYLALAPVDPRSPMQGDYMALNYQFCNDMNHLSGAVLPPAGVAVMTLDTADVGRFVRIYHGEPLAANEHLLKYRHDGWRVVIGREQFFIPEGSGAQFAKAVYGQLKVTPGGTSQLEALCDKDRKEITDTQSRQK